jgi:hypothetical protein
VQPLITLLPAVTRFADATSCAKSTSFLGLETWYAYFPASWFGVTGANGKVYNCDINNNFQFLSQNGGGSGLLLIALAIVDDLIRIAALVAVGYVIYGGFKYMTSGGSPDGTKQAQNTIINALIGVVIAILAASIVSFVGVQLSS